jgi:hypothetical protein
MGAKYQGKLMTLHTTRTNSIHISLSSNATSLAVLRICYKTKSYYSRPQRNPCLVSTGSTIQRPQDHAESVRPPSPPHLVHSPERHLLWWPPDHRSPASRIWRGRGSGSTSGRIQPSPDRACCPLPPGGHRGSDLDARGDRRRSPASGGHRRLTLAAPTLGWGSSLVVLVSCLPHRPTRRCAGPRRGVLPGDPRGPFWWPPLPWGPAPPAPH